MRALRAALAWPAAFAVLRSAAEPLLIDTTQAEQRFDGIGGLSAGASSRLLVDYPEPQRSQVLDYLFKPHYGASLQMLKVEIGGDAQSTDGTEPSHMHTPDDLDYSRGYEWWLLQEAKKRNPDLKTHGLSWGFPAWVGGSERAGSPFVHPDLTAEYTLKWLQGARDVYGIDVDYIGVWNERASDATYVKTLRRTLDAAGFANTTIVARDGDAGICNEMAGDKDYQAAVGVVGLHYPSDYQDLSSCRTLGFGVKGGKPIWSSEESSSYDDLNGAACWARITASHWVLQGITSSMIWNPVGSYMHGTNWYASSLLTAVEPWSGHYTLPEAVWATAHVTQFTQVGWNLVSVGSGSGQLPNGGFYTTYADPNSDDWTLVVVKISSDHASCTRPMLPPFTVTAENVTFQLAASMTKRRLALWRSNFEQFNPTGQVDHVFERLGDVLASDGTFELQVAVGDVYTISTILDGPTKGAPPTRIPESQPVPLPYSDDFEAVTEPHEGRWWSDQIGIFEVHADPSGNKVMRQTVPESPITWVDEAKRGPVTVLGMREWQDVSFSASFRLPEGSATSDAACIGTRSDQMWDYGVFLCLSKGGQWTLSASGPRGGAAAGQVYANGTAPPLATDRPSRLTLTTVVGTATARLEPCGASPSCTLFKDTPIPDSDCGFVAIGANGWIQVEFDDVSVKQAGPRWKQPPTPPTPAPGTPLAALPCATNGLVDGAQTFELLADWGILHVGSQLCVAATSLDDGAALVLEKCNPADSRQQLRNDYTNVRNTPLPFTVNGSSGALLLTGGPDKEVALHAKAESAGTWQSWVFFPNTRQLRNQYVADRHLGAPRCLSVFPKSGGSHGVILQV